MIYWLSIVLFLSLARPVAAGDHNNVDAGRPLSFDDAEAVAYREMAMEVGAGGVVPNEGAGGFALRTGFLYGLALNSHLNLDVDSCFGRTGIDERNSRIESVSLGLFHNFNREFGNLPAFSLKAEVSLPTPKGAKGVEVQLRGMASKALIQYDRIHLNFDGIIISAPQSDKRRFRPGIILGYTQPIGYPKSFSRTGLAEVSVRVPEQKGTGPVFSLGIGLRQQVTVRSVLDMGIQSDLLALDKSPHEDVRVIAGYSISF